MNDAIGRHKKRFRWRLRLGARVTRTADRAIEPPRRAGSHAAGASNGGSSGSHAIPTPAAAPAESTPRQQPAHHELLPAVLGSLAMRELTLAESLIQLVENAERKEDDPEALAFLYRIDHLATRMRRSCENLLVLAGQDETDPRLEPMPLLDVVRAAMSEIKHYDRVKIEALPRTAVLGLAADDLSHLIAELLDNAVGQSPRDAPIVVRGRPGNGALIVMVDDSGIGIPAERLAELNARLASQADLDLTVPRHMGLYVVSRLARRHGVYVQLQARPGNGTCVHVVVPHRLLRPMAPLRVADPTPAREMPVRSAAGGATATPALPPVTAAGLPRRPSRGVEPARLPERERRPDVPTIGDQRRSPMVPAAREAPGTAAAARQLDARPAAPLPAPAPAAEDRHGAPPATTQARTASGLPRRDATQHAPWQTAGFALPRPATRVERSAEEAARYIHHELDAFELGQHAAQRDLTARDASGAAMPSPDRSPRRPVEPTPASDEDRPETESQS